MDMTFRRCVTLVAAAIVVVGMYRAVALTAPLAGTTSLANNYQRVDNPLKFPDGRNGWIFGIVVDPNGSDVWVLDSCGGKDLQTCATSNADPVLKFDSSGKFLKSFGGGVLLHPHGLYIDPSGNIWVVDGYGLDEKQPPMSRGHQVHKFSPDGKLLLSLGTAGVRSKTEKTFYWPSDVLVAPNGDIFVADGHGGESNDRIVKFTKDGKYITSWGSHGTGRGQFNETHSLAMDSKGRLFVGDRRNFRIQIFDQSGNFLDEWKQFGEPSEIFIDKHDVMYVAVSETDEKTNPDYPNGVYVGSAKDGKVTGFIPDALPNQRQELVAVDGKGTVWTGFTVGHMVRKYVKQ
jgi:DNA-binding beta-propeller fold protein YncE